MKDWTEKHKAESRGYTEAELEETQTTLPRSPLSTWKGHHAHMLVTNQVRHSVWLHQYIENKTTTCKAKIPLCLWSGTYPSLALVSNTGSSPLRRKKKKHIRLDEKQVKISRRREEPSQHQGLTLPSFLADALWEAEWGTPVCSVKKPYYKEKKQPNDHKKAAHHK